AQRVEHRADGPARPAPRGVEVDEHRHRAAVDQGLHRVVGEIDRGARGVERRLAAPTPRRRRQPRAVDADDPPTRAAAEVSIGHGALHGSTMRTPAADGYSSKSPALTTRCRRASEPTLRENRW